MKNHRAYNFHTLCVSLFLLVFLSLLFFNFAQARPVAEVAKEGENLNKKVSRLKSQHPKEPKKLKEEGNSLSEEQEWAEVERKLQEAQEKIEKEHRKLSKGKSKSKPKKKKKRNFHETSRRPEKNLIPYS